MESCDDACVNSGKAWGSRGDIGALVGIITTALPGDISKGIYLRNGLLCVYAVRGYIAYTRTSTHARTHSATHTHRLAHRQAGTHARTHK